MFLILFAKLRLYLTIGQVRQKEETIPKNKRKRNYHIKEMCADVISNGKSANNEIYERAIANPIFVSIFCKTFC